MSDSEGVLRLATRGSDLAMRQAALIRETLESRRQRVELVEVETTGDQVRDELIHRLGTTGAFVRRLDEKILSGEVDAAVHSMKDMPTDQPDALVVAGIPERASPADVLVTPADTTTIDALPEDARVGTASLRRGAQLRATRTDLEIAGLRGNVDTRLEKLLAPGLQHEHEVRLAAAEAETDGESDGTENAESAFDQSVQSWFESLSELQRQALGRAVETEYDGIVLAAAGLERSGLLHHVPTTRLAPESFVPAPGQGAIAVTAANETVAETIHDAVDHPPTRVETTVERTILDELGGGCVAPVGIHAQLKGGVVTTAVRVLSRDGSEEIAATRELPVTEHASAAVRFASDLAAEGAADLIAAARREEPDAAKRGPETADES